MKSNPIPRMHVDVSEWLNDLQEDSLEVKGLMVVLSLQQWRLGSLPADQDKLQRLAGASGREWKRSWALVAERFPLCTNGSRKNAELEEMYREALQIAAVKSARAKNAAEARYGAKTEKEDAQGTPSSTPSSSANGMPIPNRTEPNRIEITKNEQTRSEGTHSTEQLPPTPDSSSGSLFLNSSPGLVPVSGSESSFTFASARFTPADAVRHACTGSRAGDVRARDIFDAVGTMPPLEALKICDEVNLIRTQERRTAGYLVGALRNKLGIGKGEE